MTTEMIDEGMMIGGWKDEEVHADTHQTEEIVAHQLEDQDHVIDIKVIIVVVMSHHHLGERNRRHIKDAAYRTQVMRNQVKNRPRRKRKAEIEAVLMTPAESTKNLEDKYCFALKLN